MCGRFTRNYTWAQIHSMYSLVSPASNLQPRFNICTTNVDVVIRGEGRRSLVPMRWGLIPCVYRIFDSAWTQRTDGVSSRSDEGSVQADSRRRGFALQVESKAGSRNPGLTATDQCASQAGTETDRKSTR